MTETKKQPKVMVGIATYSGEEYCLEEFINSLKLLTYDNIEIVFVDNSEDDFYADKIRGHDFKVVRDPPGNKNRIERIISARNKIKDIFLDSNNDYLLFLDSDVIAPNDIIQRLLDHDKDICAGIYLGGTTIQGKVRIMPVVFLFHDKEKNLVRIPSRNEVAGNDFVEAAAAGLGCTLISRGVLENITFRNIGRSTTGGEDAAFYKDARENSHDCFVDYGVKCFHMTYPQGDPRNNLYRFETKI